MQAFFKNPRREQNRNHRLQSGQHCRICRPNPLESCQKRDHANHRRYQYDANTRTMNRTVTGADFGPLLNDLGGTIDLDAEGQEAVVRNLLLFIDMHLKLWAK